MNSRKTKLVDSLFMAWTIASKDILDAVKNKTTRTNIILIVGMVVFLYWASTPRPFDKKIDIVVYDEGESTLTNRGTALKEGYKFRFFKASSYLELESMMGYKELGVIIPADFDQILETGGEPALTGHILWVHRAKSDELEAKYANKFTELVGQPVRVEIGENFIIPKPDVESNTVHVHILYAAFIMAISVVPYLMLEERQNRTMEALLVSPASAGQVVLGKALAGLFFVVLSGGLFLALNWAYIINWGLALLAFLCTALFSIGVALILGTYIQSPKQLAIWTLPIIFFLLVPSFFATDPNLMPGLKAVFSWIPTAALANILKLAMSSSAPVSQLLRSLGITIASTILVYTVVVWKIRRLDK